MKPMPIILVREFGGLDICYRIPARRARNYWELLQNIHNTFSKIWERYNAHLHVDDHTCNDRISPSEWDAGGYFDAEFVVNGKLVLYAHFEEVQGRTMEGVGGAPECEALDAMDRTWYRGMYGDKGLKTKGYVKEEWDGDDEDCKDDPYPPFPETLPDDGSILRPTIRSAPTARRNLTPTNAVHKVITIDDSNSKRLLETGIIIGRAMPHCCRDPNVRPVVRAMINKVGALIAYIPSKYAKRNYTKGDIQISLKDVEYHNELERIPFGENRAQVIKAMIESKNASNTRKTTPDSRLSTVELPDPEPNLEVRTIDDCRHTRLLTEGIVIGRAKPDCCCNPQERPLVRAMLNSRDAIMAFIPARYAKHERTHGELQIPLKDVDLGQGLADLAPENITDTIRARIEQRARVRKELGVSVARQQGRAELEEQAAEEEVLELVEKEEEPVGDENDEGFQSDTTTLSDIDMEA